MLLLCGWLCLVEIASRVRMLLLDGVKSLLRGWLLDREAVQATWFEERLLIRYRECGVGRSVASGPLARGLERFRVFFVDVWVVVHVHVRDVTA